MLARPCGYIAIIFNSPHVYPILCRINVTPFSTNLTLTDYVNSFGIIDEFKYIFPFRRSLNFRILEKPKKYSNKFPVLFFVGVFIIVGITIGIARFGYEAMPRNSIADCKKQFINTELETAGFEFCECIHENGKPLDTCLLELENAKQ